MHSTTSPEEWLHKWRRWVDHLGPAGDWPRREILDGQLLVLLENPSGKVILDVGCGEGRFSRLLAAHGAQVVGIDIVPGMIELAKSVERGRPGKAARDRWPWFGRRWPRRRENGAATFAVADLTRLPIRYTGAFDAAIACCTLNCVADLGRAAAALSYGLKEGGACITAVPHPALIRPCLQNRTDVAGLRSPRAVSYVEYICAGFEITNYYHSMPQIVNAFAQSHLLLERLEEPLLSAAGARRNRKDIAKVRGIRGFPDPSTNPWFLIARFVKVSNSE